MKFLKSEIEKFWNHRIVHQGLKNGLYFLGAILNDHGRMYHCAAVELCWLEKTKADLFAPSEFNAG